MVAPTLKNRSQAMDVLRGIAILGILFANIAYFAGPYDEAFLGFFDPSQGTVNHWVQQLTLAFVTGKFRSMLAVLFGAGLYLQYKKRIAIPGAWPGGYLKRTMFLALFGLVHGYLIWAGDILFIYSGMAFVACVLLDQNRKLLNGIAWFGVGLSVFLGILFFAAGWLPGDSEIGKLMLAGMTSPESQMAAYGPGGNYLLQLQDRALMFTMTALGIVVYLPFGLPLFVLGIRLAETGVLAAPSQHPNARRKMLFWGLGVGLPLNLLAVAFIGRDMNPLMGLAWEVLFGPLLALGYLIVGAMMVEKGVLTNVSNAVANVGRMALSCYILQSILCSIVFYSWGFGLFGQLDATQQLGVVAGVWAANLIFAALWLKRFPMGPLEWLLRSLTEGRRIETREQPAAPQFQL